MHKWHASSCLSKISIIHNDSGSGSLETSVHPKQFSANAKLGRARQPTVQPPTVQPPTSASVPGLMNIFIPNVSMPRWHWTANLVIKSILHSTEPIEYLIYPKAHRWPPLYDTSGYVWTLGCAIGSTTVTVAMIHNRETKKDAMRNKHNSMWGKHAKTVSSLRKM